MRTENRQFCLNRPKVKKILLGDPPKKGERQRERGDTFFPRCALIRGMHETSNADWLDAKVTVDASLPLRLYT